MTAVVCLQRFQLLQKHVIVEDNTLKIQICTHSHTHTHTLFAANIQVKLLFLAAQMSFRLQETNLKGQEF